MEARVNTKPLSKEEVAKAVDWTEINGSGSIKGTLMKVQCGSPKTRSAKAMSRQIQLEVKDEMGNVLHMVVPDPSQISIAGGDGTLACGGVQKPRDVTITFKPATAPGTIRDSPVK